MRYSGIQPQYFPRLHYFARILSADVFVIRDDAQFVRKHKYPDGKADKSYQAHTPLKHAGGVYLPVVPTTHSGLLPLSKTEISYGFNWRQNHLKTLQTLYTKAPNFQKIYKDIEKLLSMNYSSLAELNIATILWGILRLKGEVNVRFDTISIENVERILKDQRTFRLKTIRRASQSYVVSRANLSANEKIVALCREVGADEDYCGGTGVAAYIDKKLFEEHGITITVQDWKCREYLQCFMKQQGFIPNLSIIDLLMNASSSEAVSIIKG